MRRIFFLILCGSFLLPLCVSADTTNVAITRAMAAMNAAAPRAQADPAHPIFHVSSPAQWMNDPNGPIYYKGYYHLFFQLNPYGEGGGPKYWGHVRSRDLVNWEHLPIALWPSTEADEAEVWSGCCTINGLGQPMAFYTSIAPGKAAFDHASQWAAIGDDDLMQWQKSPANPVLTEDLHGSTKIYEWRDPFIFQNAGKTFLVTGGNVNRTQGGAATVNIYEALNPALTQWKYRGVLFEDTDPAAKTAECPNFFKVGDQWVLFMSPYGPVQYFVGDFDADTCRFHPHSHGVLDVGNFYAPNTMQVPDGRRLMWGWVTGFPGGHGWNGCLTLPRLLSVSSDGQLHQDPAPQLTKLRGKGTSWKNLKLDGGDGKILPLPATNTLEIRTEITLGAGTNITLSLHSGDAHAQPVNVSFDGTTLSVLDSKVPLTPSARKRQLILDIFVDRSVLEVYANGTVCLTKLIVPLDDRATVNIQGQAGVVLKRIQAWPMKSIWSD